MSAGSTIRPLLVANLVFVFLPVLLVQLAAPTFMRGRTSPIPGGAIIGAIVVLLLVAGSWRVAIGRARRSFGAEAMPCGRKETLVLASTALLVILLGQSLLAGLAEAIGVVRPAAGDAGFAIDYARYVLVTVLAYAWTVSVLTLLSAALTVGSARALAEAGPTAWRRHARLAAILAGAAAIVVLALKVVQHLA
jgi:hypothetical protein